MHNKLCAVDDVILLAFLPNFGSSQDLTQTQNYVNIAFHNLAETQAGIQSCKSAGKPIILSIGGGAGNYGFDRCDHLHCRLADLCWHDYCMLAHH